MLRGFAWGHLIGTERRLVKLWGKAGGGIQASFGAEPAVPTPQCRRLCQEVENKQRFICTLAIVSAGRGMAPDGYRRSLTGGPDWKNNFYEHSDRRQRTLLSFFLLLLPLALWSASLAYCG
jgi:hypothetical protein